MVSGNWQACQEQYIVPGQAVSASFEAIFSGFAAPKIDHQTAEITRLGDSELKHRQCQNDRQE